VRGVCMCVVYVRGVCVVCVCVLCMCVVYVACRRVYNGAPMYVYV